MTKQREKIQIIGGTEEEKNKAKEFYERRLLEHKESLSEKEKEFLKENEIEKTKEQIKIIEGVNKIVRKVGKEIGVDLIGIPLDNIHILSDENYWKVRGYKGNDEKAVSSFKKQGIAVNKEKIESNFDLASTILHEILHLEGILVVKAENGKHYREGIGGLSTKKGDLDSSEYGVGIHEAIVSYQEKKSRKDLLKLPELKKDLEKLKLIEKIEDEDLKKLGITRDEISWIREDKFITYGYYHPRKTLDFVMNEIQKNFPDKYENKEEVFKEFLKAQFERGHLLKVGELVERTFGKDSFRTLMNMEDDEKNAINTRKLLKNILLNKPKRNEMEEVMKRQKKIKEAKSKAKRGRITKKK